MLIITGNGYSQTPTSPPGQSQTFTINQGASAVLNASSINAVAYQWYKNNLPISGAIGASYSTSVAGLYYVVAYNAEGCPSIQSDGINVNVIPTAVSVALPPIPHVSFPHLGKPYVPVDLMVNIQSTNTKPAIGDNFNYVLTANNNSKSDGTNVLVTYVLPPMLTYIRQTIDSAVSYDTITRKLTWKIDRLKPNDPVDLTVSVKVLQSGEIQSIVDIIGNEPDPIMENNVAKDVEQVSHLPVPNVFTPNGDGINDSFYIPGLDTYAETQLSIVNRWGGTVYEKKNYQNDWTGDGLPEGTYFYVLKVKTLVGIWDVYKGYVTLLRSRM